MRPAAAAAALLALGLVACGGDDPPTRAEYVTSAGKICREAEKRIAELGDASDPDRLARAIDDVIDETRATSDKLQDLARPDGEAGETATKWVETLDEELENELIPVFEDLRDAIEAEDRQAVSDAAEELRKLEDTASDKYARELGVTACVS
jgi:hypothetical protein